MNKVRTLIRVKKSQSTIEGAGVRLNRAFGNSDDVDTDPFLLLDDFHSDNPDDYIAGFPRHPHRGMETVTYMIHGRVEHRDSLGNTGVIGPGDVQWMTAGSGIIHSEMPRQEDGLMRGLQLWVNLPASHKMKPPRYQEIPAAQIPQTILENGTRLNVICGNADSIEGPVREIAADPVYLDITIPAGADFSFPIKQGHTVFAYVLEGAGYFDAHKKELVSHSHLVTYSDGDSVYMKAGENGVRFLLIAGKPIGEPVAWYGPIVMNTEEEIRIAFHEYQEGTFIKHKQKFDGI